MDLHSGAKSTPFALQAFRWRMVLPINFIVGESQLNSSDHSVENAATCAVCGQKYFELNLCTLLFKSSAKRSTVNCQTAVVYKQMFRDRYTPVIGVLDLS